MSAFNCSPGGSCCDPRASNLWDIYGYPTFFFTSPGGPVQSGYVDITRHPQGFARQGTVNAFDFANIPPPGGITKGGLVYNSKEHAESGNWFIPPSQPLALPVSQFTNATAVGGYEQVRENVWAIEKRDNVRWAVKYDAVGATELLKESVTPFLGTVGGDSDANAERLLTTVSQDEWFFHGNFRAARIDVNGVYQTGQVVIASGISIDRYAPRAYPRCCGYHRDSNGAIVGQFVGNVVVGFSGPTCNISADVDVTLDLNPAYRWAYFDASPNHWVGVLTVVIPGGFHFIVIIDNEVVMERYSTNPTLFEQSIGGRAVMQPHIAHSSEADGNAYVVIPTKQWDTEPTPANLDGILEDPERPYTAVVFKDGEEEWRTPPRCRPVIAKTSSDRWLYCTGWEGNLATNAGLTSTPTIPMDGTVFGTSNGGDYSNGQPYWVIRHDGSQAAPCGRVTFSQGNFGLIAWHGSGPDGFGSFVVEYNFAPYVASGFANRPLVSGGAIVRGFHDVVKNSSLVGSSLPQDAAEWPSLV